MKAYAGTHPGLRRERNEDAFLCQPERGLFAVADGLGGLSYGEVASRMAVEIIGDQADGAFEDITTLVRNVSHLIREKGRSLASGTIGTTLTLALVKGPYIRIAQVGDSVAFLLPLGGKPVQLTVEQTMADERRRAGRADIEPYMDHVLTQCLGQEREVNPDVFMNDFPAGARLLLCSDGITKTLSRAEIFEVLAHGSAPEEIVDTLIRRANEAGGPDNSTAVVVFNDAR